MTFNKDNKIKENNKIKDKDRDNNKDKDNKDKDKDNDNDTERDEEVFKNYSAEWSTQHEFILVEWADKAICYRWLHSASHISYSFKNRWFTVPVII